MTNVTKKKLQCEIFLTSPINKRTLLWHCYMQKILLSKFNSNFFLFLVNQGVKFITGLFIQSSEWKTLAMCEWMCLKFQMALQFLFYGWNCYPRKWNCSPKQTEKNFGFFKVRSVWGKKKKYAHFLKNM